VENLGDTTGQHGFTGFTIKNQVLAMSFTRPGKLSHNYGKSPFLMGKSTINGHFQ